MAGAFDARWLALLGRSVWIAVNAARLALAVGGAVGVVAARVGRAELGAFPKVLVAGAASMLRSLGVACAAAYPEQSVGLEGMFPKPPKGGN